MKIISWNVNGLRAAWNHGLSSFLTKCGADIYAFQETKTNEVLPEYVPEGYYDYWSFCSGARRGYSGTLILSRYPAISCRCEFPEKDFNCEGRLISLDFGSFYFVNCYVPNSQRSEWRKDYRNRWDELFSGYLKILKYRKPVVVCGDFNVPISDNDIYAENKWVELNQQGFQSTERENLLAIIDSGFTDAYRLIHPDEIGKYTWWSNRLCKRKENRGWRLDYFLITNNLREKLTECMMHTRVNGSDHCPIELDIALAPECDADEDRQPHREKVHYADLLQMDSRDYLNATKNADMAELWNSVDWQRAEENLAEMQRSLAKFAYRRKMDSVTFWQKRIVRSLDAKLLAVRHVCSTDGGSGVDSIKWTSAEEKMLAALSLTSKGYHALPARLLLVKSKSGKQRRIHIETYYDRAMQTLYSYALDPIAESWGDRKSFAYRKGRSAYDLNEYIKDAFSGADAPEWAFIGDIRKCYEHISHDWILENIPMDKSVLKEFLRAGYVFAGELYPMQEGIGIGCTLSPIIANMVLDGLQEHIYERLYPGESKRDYPNGNLVRYADDIFVAVRTEQTAHEIWKSVEGFLSKRGLTLSPEKTRVINVNDGFVFMSREYFIRNGYMCSRPSEAAVERFMQSLRETIENHTGSQKSLIDSVNRKIDGWTTYHKIGEADQAFRHVDVYIRGLLLELCQKKHPKWSKEKVLAKYWYQDSLGRNCYALPDKREVRIKFLQDVLFTMYHPVNTKFNPYIDTDYVERRVQDRQIRSATGIYRGIWNRQNGTCYYCGRKILIDQERTVVEVDGSKSRKAARLAYVHTSCLSTSFESINALELPESWTDVMKLLQQLDFNRKPLLAMKMLPLSEFFRTCSKHSVTLTFKEMEEIMGEELGVGADQKSFWYRTGFNNISQCWLDNGYQIKRLHLTDRKRVVFVQTSESKNTACVEIPEVIQHGRIPDAAKYELENYFQYIIRKYGL